MPKPPPKADNGNNHAAQRLSPLVSKTTAMAEIILFPNGKDEIPFIPGFRTNPETKKRWLHLADYVLEGKRKRKKA